MVSTPMNKYRALITRTLSELVSINSVKAEPSLNMPYGKGVFNALMYMLDTAEKLDLESCNLFGHMGYAAYGSGQQTLALLTHLDVVPAGDGWDTDPFKAVIKDGKMFGRGTVDNKGAAVASLFALYAIKESCITLNKNVRVMFGCDEESGWGDIDFYKEHYESPDIVISPDASFPIYNSEKGLLHLKVTAPTKNKGALLSVSSGTRVNIVPSKAECLLKLPVETVRSAMGDASPAVLRIEQEAAGVRVYSEGVASHGAHPEGGVNALTHLLRAVSALPLGEGDAESFMGMINSLIGLELHGETLGIKASDEISGELTVNLGAMNTDADSITALIDIRTPISSDVPAIYEKLKALFASHGASAEIIHMQTPHHVPEDSEVVTALKKVYEKRMGEPAECLCCAGATYARAFDSGVAFGPVAPGKDACEHGPNENIELDDVIKLAEVLAYAIIELAAAPGSENEL